MLKLTLLSLSSASQLLGLVVEHENSRNNSRELSDIENANSMSCETNEQKESRIQGKKLSRELRARYLRLYSLKRTNSEQDVKAKRRKVIEPVVASYFASSRIGLRGKYYDQIAAVWVLRRNVILSKYEEMNLDGNVVLREEIIKPAEDERKYKQHDCFVGDEVRQSLLSSQSSSSRQRVIDTHFAGLVSCSMKFKFRNRRKSVSSLISSYFCCWEL